MAPKKNNADDMEGTADEAGPFETQETAKRKVRRHFLKLLPRSHVPDRPLLTWTLCAVLASRTLVCTGQQGKGRGTQASKAGNCHRKPQAVAGAEERRRR